MCWGEQWEEEEGESEAVCSKFGFKTLVPLHFSLWSTPPTIIISFSSKYSSDRTQARLHCEQICLYYPARKGPIRLTVAKWQSQRWVGNKRAKCSITREGKVVVDQGREAKRKLIIPNPKNILHKQYTLTLAESVHHFCLHAPSLSFPFTYLWGFTSSLT